MLVTIYPGVGRSSVLETLRDIHSKIGDAANVHGSVAARAIGYLDWANDWVRMLEHRVGAADIDRLVLGPGYERLLSATGILTGSVTGTQGVLSGLVRHETEQQGELLAEAIKRPAGADPPLAPGLPVRGRRHVLLYRARGSLRPGSRWCGSGGRLTAQRVSTWLVASPDHQHMAALSCMA